MAGMTGPGVRRPQSMCGGEKKIVSAMGPTTLKANAPRSVTSCRVPVDAVVADVRRPQSMCGGEKQMMLAMEPTTLEAKAPRSVTSCRAHISMTELTTPEARHDGI